MSAATIINLVVNQKSSFQVQLNVLNGNNAPLDLTGYTANAKFKTDVSAADETAVAFTTSLANTTNGSITIALSHEQTAAMQLGKYIYDVAITDDATDFKTRIVEGKITVSGGVT